MMDSDAILGGIIQKMKRKPNIFCEQNEKKTLVTAPCLMRSYSKYHLVVKVLH